jgi:hypothetical protein
MAILYDSEEIGFDRIDLYDAALEIQRVGDTLAQSLGRQPSAWELTSATVGSAKAGESAVLHKLLEAYRAIDAASQDDLLSPEARIADQIYGLSAHLCVDGCQACLHQGGDMMSDSLVATSVSRQMLQRFLRG